MKMVEDILGDLNPDCSVTIKGHVAGYASMNYELHGPGYGDLCKFLFKMGSM